MRNNPEEVEPTNPKAFLNPPHLRVVDVVVWVAEIFTICNFANFRYPPEN